MLGSYLNNTKSGISFHPSTKYLDIAFGASGASYIAPADGWFYSTGSDTGGTIQRFDMVMRANNTRYGSAYSFHTDGDPTTDGWSNLNLFVKKGQTISIYYYGLSSTQLLRFLYAE